MRESFRDDEIKSLWREILTDKSVEISMLNEPESRERTLLIRYEEMDSLNREFALNFLKYPKEYLEVLSDELENEFLSEGFKSRKDKRLNIAISSSLLDLRRSIRDLRSIDLNTFIQIDGIVKRVSEVIPVVVAAAYNCSYCHTINLYPQTGSRLYEPIECSQCGHTKDSTKFQFVPERSVYMDTQIIHVEEKPELLKGASQPAKLVVHLEDDICGKFNPGDRVTINGILNGRQRIIGNVPTKQFEMFLDAMYIERESTEFEEVQISNEDVERINQSANDPEIYSKLVASVAPTIFAMETVKEAVIFQLFGGVRKIFEDGTYVRGDAHILLFGDPGCIIDDERIVLGNGGIIKIGRMGTTHLESVNRQVLTGQGYRRELAKTFFKYKAQPIMEVVTESGKSIRGTYNHPLLTIETADRGKPLKSSFINYFNNKQYTAVLTKKPIQKWKRLDEINVGDKVQVVPRIRCTITKPQPTGFIPLNNRLGPKSKGRLPDKVTENLAALLGYMLGDGWVTDKYKCGFIVSDSEKELLPKLLNFVESEIELLPKIRSVIPSDHPRKDYEIEGRKVHRREVMHNVEIGNENLASNLDFIRNKRVPDFILSSGNKVVSHFLKWLFTADGCVFSNGRGRRAIQLKAKNIELLRDVQMLLLRFGIHSQILEADKERDAYNLVIRRSKDFEKFDHHIGFALSKKQKKLGSLVQDTQHIPHKRSWNRSERVIAVRKVGFADVYDIEVPIGHRFIANGIISHNTAKSQILKYATTIAPKSIYTSGKGSSSAGLTAAAVKDEFSEGRWTLEAGALVLADGGLAGIDELDKMSREDSGAMHESMEQQSVSISKAGISATLMSRCAILAAANPKFGRYDEGEAFINQTDFPATLLSRFDLIFIIVDRPGKTDVEMANYILKVHSDGEKIAGGINIEKSEFKPYFDHEFLKKYIVYAKRFCFPILSPGAKEKIAKFYVEKRMSTSKQGSVAISPRQLEAMIRLSEASARIRLSDRVTEDDVERAEKLMESFLNQTTLVNGIPDIDVLLSGYASKDRKGLISLSSIIRRMEDSKKARELSLEEIQEGAKKAGMDEHAVEANIKLLHDKGQLIETKNGFYRLVRS